MTKNTSYAIKWLHFLLKRFHLILKTALMHMQKQL